MSANIRPGSLRAYALGVLTGTIMTATLTMCAAPAKADVPIDVVSQYAGPVCSVLSDYPSTDGVMGIGLALADEGWTAREAGEIIALSVISTCPQFTPILNAFVARYGDKAAVV